MFAVSTKFLRKNQITQRGFKYEVQHGLKILNNFRGQFMKYLIYVIVSVFMLSSAVPSFADHHESKEKKEKKDKKDK